MCGECAQSGPSMFCEAASDAQRLVGLIELDHFRKPDCVIGLVVINDELFVQEARESAMLVTQTGNHYLWNEGIFEQSVLRDAVCNGQD